MVEKLFEKIDDNPGEYFGMLVEEFEDKKESLNEDSEYKTLAKLSNGLEVISYPYGYAVSDGYVADRFVVRDGKYIFDDGRFRLSDKDKQKILSLINKGVIGESLKEDKFVPKDKMSKKAQKELNDKKRGTWGNTNPVTRVQPNKKAYDRKRDKKELDEDINSTVLDNRTRSAVKEGAMSLQYINDLLFDAIDDSNSTYGDLDNTINEIRKIADLQDVYYRYYAL